MEQITVEQIEQNYKAALDSVNLLNNGNVHNMPEDEWNDCVKINLEHLKIILAKDYWTTEDLTPLENAIK